MSRQLRKVLLELRDQRLLQAYEQGRTSVVEDLVFPGNREGEPLRARLLQEACTRILADAGMRKFRFHDLRHTFGSLLIEEGAPLPYVRDQMGHSSIQITADKYVHLVAQRNVRFIDRLDTATSPQPSATQAQPSTKSPVQDASVSSPQVIDRKGWCERGDSNPHPLRDQILSLARLPVPPLSRLKLTPLLYNYLSGGRCSSNSLVQSAKAVGSPPGQTIRRSCDSDCSPRTWRKHPGRPTNIVASSPQFALSSYKTRRRFGSIKNT
jgi:hypothetical protein